MIILVGRDGRLGLAEAEDFRRFHIELADAGMSDSEAVAALGPGAEAAGAGEAWISADLVRRLAARGVEWDGRFTAMLTSVSRFGWSSEDLSRVRAHLKRPEAPPEA